MANLNSPRDANRKPADSAQKEGLNETGYLRVDPVTNRLLIDIQVVDDVTGSAYRQRIDDNRHHAATAAEQITGNISAGQPLGLLQALTYASDTSGVGTGEPLPLLIDSRNGYLWVDLGDETPPPPTPPTGTPIGLLLALTYQV